MPEEKVKMNLNGLMVDDRTKEKFIAWSGESERKYAPLVQQLVLFAMDNGFDPTSARVKWKDCE